MLRSAGTGGENRPAGSALSGPRPATRLMVYLPSHHRVGVKMSSCHLVTRRHRAAGLWSGGWAGNRPAVMDSSAPPFRHATRQGRPSTGGAVLVWSVRIAQTDEIVRCTGTPSRSGKSLLIKTAKHSGA